jgi:hypothetical protein
MDAIVWVPGYQVQDFGFAVDQEVTWPMRRLREAGSLVDLVGSDVATQAVMGPDWYARRPEDTVDHTGTIRRIESYRCRHSDSQVVRGSVEVRPVEVAVFAGPPEDSVGLEDGVDFVGYLVTLANLRPTQ